MPKAEVRRGQVLPPATQGTGPIVVDKSADRGIPIALIPELSSRTFQTSSHASSLPRINPTMARGSSLVQRAQELTKDELDAVRDRMGLVNQRGFAITGFAYPPDDSFSTVN
jgi:hypothetical protein